MKVAFYSIQDFEKGYLTALNKKKHVIFFTDKILNEDTAPLAQGYDAVSIFTLDDASEHVLEKLHSCGIKYIILRSVGFDHIDLKKAKQLKIKVANVPEYSPYSIAEHGVALILALNRKLIQANLQVHQNNFKIDNLIGFDLNKKTVGIVGTGKIGSVTAKIMYGFGCNILANDIQEKEYLIKHYNVKYVDLNSLCSNSDIIILNCSLNDTTRYLINKQNIAQMKNGVMLINTARGLVINTLDVLEGLISKKIGALGIDVYENEKGIFYKNNTKASLKDPILTRLLNMENVIITGHQAFLTKEALEAIENTTMHTIDCWESGAALTNELV